MTGGAAVPLIIDLLIGVGIGIAAGVATWALGSLLTGNKLTWEGLAIAALDSFVISSAFAVVYACVSAIKLAARGSIYTQAELTDTSNLKVNDMAYDNMLPNEKAAYDGYSAHGWKGNYPGQQPGVRAGKTYFNDNSILPQGIYREFDINPKIPGLPRDATRFVVSQNYTVYLTRDHYETFFRIIK